jgi:hypothetical protein
MIFHLSPPANMQMNAGNVVIFPSSMVQTISLTRTSVLRAYLQAAFIDQSQPSIIGAAIYVDSNRVASVQGVADYGVREFLNTQRSMLLTSGQHSVSVELSGQFTTTFCVNGGRDDVTYLNLEVQ